MEGVREVSTGGQSVRRHDGAGASRGQGCALGVRITLVVQAARPSTQRVSPTGCRLTPNPVVDRFYALLGETDNRTVRLAPLRVNSGSSEGRSPAPRARIVTLGR